MPNVARCACCADGVHKTEDGNGGPDPTIGFGIPDTIPGNTSTTVVLGVGSSITGTISPEIDQDWFRIDLVAGQTYVFNLAGTAVGGLQDPILTLYNPSGVQIEQNDDFSGLNSQITYTATTSGTFFIAASAYPDSAYDNVGTYTLSAAIGTQPPASSPLSSINWGTQITVSPATPVYVYFATNGQTFDGQTSTGWSALEIQQSMLAFQQFSNVINVTFQQTTNQAQATFTLVQNSNNLGLGYFNPPGTLNAGVGWFGDTGQGWTPTGLAQGGYGFITLIHEFGHGMGLAHPHDNGGTSTVMTGVSGAFGSLGSFSLNQGIYTTMSYNDGWQLAPHGISPTNDYGWQGTLMALDIAALQTDYGANTTYNSGNTVYSLPGANAAGTYYQCIWDSGGTDTIYYGGAIGCIIDLTAATLDYSATGGGVVSYVGGVHGGFTIAANVVIENATGGSSDDALTGNAAANTLNGLAGNDQLNGGAGADTMYGGIGNDTYYVDSASDVVFEVAGQGTDTVVTALGFYQLATDNTVENLTYTGVGTGVLYGNSAVNTLTGNDQVNSLNGFFGADTLLGGGGNDFLYIDNTDIINGGTGYDAVYVQTATGTTVNLAASNTEFVVGFSGNDILNGAGALQSVTLLGGAGNDTLTGSSFGDYIYFDGSDTSINAGAGYDVLVAYNATAGVNLNITAANGEYVIGSAAADVLNAAGSAVSVAIQGGLGGDTITGGNASDYLYGQGGADIFVVTANAQFDAILDFTDTNGVNDDRIDLRALGANFNTLAEVLAAATDYSGTTVINFGGGNQLYLYLVPKANLDASDFIF